MLQCQEAEQFSSSTAHRWSQFSTVLHLFSKCHHGYNSSNDEDIKQLGKNNNVPKTCMYTMYFHRARHQLFPGLLNSFLSPIRSIIGSTAPTTSKNKGPSQSPHNWWTTWKSTITCRSRYSWELVRFPWVVDETFKEIQLLYHQKSHLTPLSGQPPITKLQLTGAEDYVDLSAEWTLFTC